MRRTLSSRLWALGALAAIAVMALTLTQVGAAPTTKKKKKVPPLKVQETVGDIGFVVSSGELKVEGVGLVTGLDNTGGDPPPSFYRKQLVDEMSKAGVEKPERLLASPQVSMVIVKMSIPMGVNPDDPLDVQVEVPPACGTKSLAGGYLLMSRLFRIAIAKGETLRDHELAIAQGPIMIGTPAKPKDPKVGRILGGGRIKKDYPYTLVIKENRESYHTAKMLETVINTRFHQTEDGHQKGAATGKSDKYLILRVPALYHQNQPRYFRVVQSLPMVDGPELRVRRLAAWSKDLLDPKTAGVAALKLEGLGNASIEALKEGLKSTNDQVKFFSGEALAYLNDSAGVEVLGETVIKHPEFRVYALAALASMDQGASHTKLRKLMDEPDIEVRYGAFNALRTLDPHDPFLGQVSVLVEQKPDEEQDEPADSMAVEILNSKRRRSRPQDPFALYVVDSDGPPLVHVSRSRRAELVIFGRQQKLLPPIVLGTGPIQFNAGDNDDKLEVSKIVVGDSDTKVSTSLELADVVRQAANIGASYPDIVAVLEEAHAHKNLPGGLVVDAVPATTTVYLEAILGRDTTAKRDSAVDRASAEAASRPRWRFFSLFNRDRDINPTTAQSQEPTPRTIPANATNPGTASSPASVAKTNATAGADAKKSGTGTTQPVAKTDEGVQKTSADASPAPPPPRRRFFDFLRKDDDD
jgi:flagellar basal body P-ring protein FlgI